MRTSTLENSGMLASRRPILESNPSIGDDRFPRRNPFTGIEADGSIAPPLPFVPVSSNGIDPSHSFPIGQTATIGDGFPLTATPPEGIPNLGGVTNQQEDNFDTSAPNYSPPSSARRLR